MNGRYCNCFNYKPSNPTAEKSKQASESSTSAYAEVTSPFAIDIKEGCCVGKVQGEYMPIVLTLKTEVPITRRVVKPTHGISHETVTGKPTQCSNQANCPFNTNKDCLLNIQEFGCDNKRLHAATFAKMKPETLEALIKSDGYGIVNKKRFLRSLYNLGLSWAIIWRTVDPYLPKGKTRAVFFSKRHKKLLETPVNKQFLEQFIRANGYEIVKTHGIVAASKTCGLTSHMVHKILVLHPPKEPYVRGNLVRRKTGEHDNKRRLSAPIKPKTLECFIKANGYEIAKKQGIGAAASACGLHRCTVAKIMNHLSKMVGEQTILKQ